MDKEQRKQLLKRLATSPEGEALEEHLQGLILQLTDSRNYKSDEFEMEGKSSLKASAILEKVLKDLNILKRKKSESKKTSYN